MDAQKALQKAIEIAGGQTALGRKIGAGQNTVRYWLKDSKQGASGDYVLKIEQVTGVSRYELRPDIFKPQLIEPTVRSVDRAVAPSGGGHFSRYRHLRRDHFKSDEEIEQHIAALREEWAHR